MILQKKKKDWVRNQLNIEIDNAKQDELIKIITLDGRVIKECSTIVQKKMCINVSDLNPGMYIVKIGFRNYKILKQ